MSATMRESKADAPRKAPGPKGLPVLGSILDLRREGVLTFYLDMWREYGDVVRLDDVDTLTYTRMLIDEVLRLYSPVAMVARDVVEDDEIDGYAIPAGSIVTITPYITHRHPEFWENPEAFDPGHFAPDRVEARPRYAYYPFGAGPRICLGKYFALQEAVLVLAEVGRRYQLRLLPGQQVDVEWAGTLRPAHDVMMDLEQRT